MEVDVKKDISDKYENIQVMIKCSEDTEQVEELISMIIQLSQGKTQIIGIKNNKNYLLKLNEIMYFYSEEKNTFCKTNEGKFKIKERLYELENALGKNYVRISNSCIVNLQYVKAFDSSLTGTIEIIFIDNTKEYVSRRRVKEVLKQIKEWGN